MLKEVTAWVEKIIIPTYPIGKPEKNPIFLEKRVYQGSSGAIYPHPVIEAISDQKVDQEYTAVFIENEYLKIMVLPELGGRIHRAYDKVRKRDFIYYNQVIKPALVGLAGPWISGGIEFNWPQHHRPSTFEAVDFSLRENKDGSKSIWINEVELMCRTKGMVSFTLYPDKAYLEIKGRLFNRTPLPQTFLWWANPAVKVNDFYQSVFPPDVYAVFDHGKRDVSTFPIATGTYYKVNYAPGTDISQYKNIPVPTSYMAIQSKYNFIGGYENDTQAGMLHVANHHVSPGKKQWTWGKGDFGKAWDKNLTDEDGPYIELMCGVFTDNQPDFSWLQPNEEKTFEQYFLPYAKIGVVKNATKEAAVNLTVSGREVTIQAYASASYPQSQIKLSSNESTLYEEAFDLSPESIYEKKVNLDRLIAAEDLLIQIYNQDKNLLVSYQPEKNGLKNIPEPATAAKQPAEISTNELLFLNGLHLEQYRHATYLPTDYYQEALSREPSDIRCNNAMGLWLLRRAQFSKAEPYFRAAIRSLTLRNPNPYDGEPYYNLGICLALAGKKDEAFDYFYKATWNDAWQHSGFFQLARISTQRGDLEEALYLIDKSLVRNYDSHSARHLKVILLRKSGKESLALDWIQQSLEIDPFNYGCHFEHYLLVRRKGNGEEAATILQRLKSTLRNAFNNYLEYALDYAHAGCYEEAIQLINEFEGDNAGQHISPLVYYYQGAFNLKLDEENKARQYFQKAAAANPDFCFPSKHEDVEVLQIAITNNPNDAKAYYYLGNYWYANGQYAEAIDCWENSIRLDDRFPTVYRNISLAYHNKLKDVARATASLEKAFALDRTDARVLMELDQFYKRQGRSCQDRLNMLNANLTLVEKRDDLYLERVTLFNLLGDYEKGKELILKRKFHPWEGGEGKTVSQFLLSHIELAKKSLLNRQFEEAALLLSAARSYPDNLGEGKLFGTQENDINYLQALAYENLGLDVQARELFRSATQGISEPVQAIFYNDPQPDKIIYQGLSWLKLGDLQKAQHIFMRLIEFAKQHLADDIRIDYFAVSLPDLLVFDQDLNLKNTIHCYYLMGLGHLGLGNYQEAAGCFRQVLDRDVCHQGALVHINMIEFLKTEEIMDCR